MEQGSGTAAERIVRMGKESNFGEHGTGPCVHAPRFIDRGPDNDAAKLAAKGCECDRYIEVWNLVLPNSSATKR